MTSESGPERGITPQSSGSAAGGPEREAGPRIIPLRGARSANAPSFSELPPPDGVEALYYEGMAAYQHRHWDEALDRFTHLKELQPTRPGLDALIEEVRWFLQLQAAAPAGAPSNEEREKKARGWNAWRKRTRTVVYLVLGALAIAGLLLVAFGNRLPWRGNRAAEDLYSLSQSRLIGGDY